MNPAPQAGEPDHLIFTGCVGTWNGLWESGVYRQNLLRERRSDWPDALQWLFDDQGAGSANVQLAVGNVAASMPLFHLLPLRALQQFGLTPLKPPLWPLSACHQGAEQLLPTDFRDRVGKAFARYVWRLLSPRALQKSLRHDHSIALLAHNLDFWLPYVELVVQRRARALGRLDYDEECYEEQRKRHRRLQRVYGDAPFTPERPLRWGQLWTGERDAWNAVKEVVDVADERGNLRAILDAFRSHKVEDDFSDLWSWEREDFERKLYAKRHRLRINFVQLEDTLPVHSPYGEVHEDLLWSDLLGLLDLRERRVLVCLRSGETRLGDIARRLGYANHSPVSKALKLIRQKVAALLN